MKYLPHILIGVLLLALGGTCWWRGKSDAQRKAEKAAYESESRIVRDSLTWALSHRDTVIRRVPVEREKIVHAAARVDTVKLGFQRDTTTADSLGTALVVIATQDTLIRVQGGHIKTLSEIVAADSGVIRLFQRQRVTDSTRIRTLDKQAAGWRVLGIKLPKVKCVAGPVAVAYPTQNVGVGAACGFGF